MPTLCESFRELETVQFSEHQGVNVLFVPETLQMFTLSATAAEVLEDFRRGSSLEEAAAKRSLEPGQLEQFLQKVVEQVERAPSAGRARKSGEPDTFIGPILPKLVFMVNNFCNLACSYCYEHETIFNEKALSMSKEVVDLAFEKFYSAFEGCSELMFIGGEPTLSPAVIEYACERATEYARSRKSEISFSMITNGARMTDHLFGIIDRFDIQVTFSLDGPKQVHDSERVHKDGSGSYDQTMRNIQRYQQKRAEKLGVECTLTRAHARHGVTVSDLARFFAETLGVSSPHIAAAGLPQVDLLNPFSQEPTRLQGEFEQAAELAMDELLAHLESPGTQIGTRAGLDLVSGMVKRLIRRQSALEMCPAGTSQLVVDPHGDIYPCWMFAGMPSYRMGNVARDDVFNSVSRRILQRIMNNNKRANAQCRVCCARYVCNVCIGNNQNSTGVMENIDESYCETIRGTLKVVLLKLGEVKASPARWAAIRGAMKASEELQQDSLPC